MAARLIREMTLQGLGFEKGQAFRGFRHLILQAKVEASFEESDPRD
jgi:hypothetical protein